MGRRSLKSEKGKGPKSEITTLGAVLKTQDRLDPSYFLFLHPDQNWELTTKAAVLSESGLNGVPKVAMDHGLKYVMGIAAVQDVIWNAKAQRKNATDAQLLEAFSFYLEHDAFIAFS